MKLTLAMRSPAATQAIADVCVNKPPEAGAVFLAVEIVVIFLITYIPAISMTLPKLTGFVQ